MQDINVFEHSEEILKTLAKGAFLNTSANNKENTMAIGWGSLGFMWGHPVFTVMVRQSRYTKELIDSNPVFTVSLPIKGDFAEAMKICGTKSGRDLNKFQEAKLITLPGKTVAAPIIQGCGLHLECRIVDMHMMNGERLDQPLTDRWYSNNDWHIYYTGIITAAYIED